MNKISLLEQKVQMQCTANQCIMYNSVDLGDNNFSPPISPPERCFFLLFSALAENKKPPNYQCFRWFAFLCLIDMRREGDSNPRIPCEINGFRDRPVQPLWHLSEGGVSMGVGVGVGSVCANVRKFSTLDF